MKQYIKDIEGCLIEVTDLKEAIFQVAMYIRYSYEHPADEDQAFYLKRRKYWKDIYTKLNLLKDKNERLSENEH